MADIASTNIDHELNAAKGWFSITALDIQGVVDSAVTFSVPDGRCMHLYTGAQLPKDCRFRTGLTNTSMPLFIWHGPRNYDVRNYGTITDTSRFMHQAIGPTNVSQCLVGKGAYELETTEFDSGKVYSANQLLTAAQANTTLATGGVLTNAGTASGGTQVKQFTDPVCGIVSRGVFRNQNGINVLAFWPMWLPGTAPA